MRAPVSTYRLQITEDFDLLEAARRLQYLHELGVDWVYLSPLLASESGSDHGYDVADHSAVDPSRGRGSGLVALANEARRLGMGVLVDIVPNHVGVARPWENEWWWHVLTHGQESPYAAAFDIDWEAAEGRLRIPVVGDDDLAEDGRIRNLRVLAGELHYHDQRFPLAPGSADRGPEEDANDVLARQHYDLVSWRDADRDLNYRRFFAVNTLVAIRVEEQEWFDRSHEQIRSWFADGLVDGLRVDHPDGLRDPGKYLDDLAELTGHAYVLVEKILEPGEELPRSWATAGTTGYDALAFVDRVLTDPAGRAALDALEARLRGAPVDWEQMVHDAKRAVADGILGSETRRISRELVAGLSEADPDDVPPFEAVVDAVAELLACFTVYRSYLPEGREHLEEAFARARRHRPDLAATLDAVAPVLGDGASPAAQRFQQTSGMVMAKGVEDCTFYRYVAADLAQRGRGRPQRLLGHPGGVPRVPRRPADRLAARDDRGVDARHQARRGRPRPDRRARRAPGDLGRGPEHAAHAGARARPGLRQPALAGRPRRVARQPRATARLRREGDARGRGPDPVDGPRRGVRGRRARLRRRRVRRRPGARRAGRAGRRGRRPGLGQRAEREAARAHHARCPGRLPGQRAVGAEPGRPRQPSPGGLRPPRDPAQGAASR